MNNLSYKISFFFLIFVSYLAISTSLIPMTKEINHIENTQVYGNFFLGAPVDVVLVDSYTEGVIIKTYYQKYLIFHGFKEYEIKNMTTSKKFYDDNKKFIGLSVFRRDESGVMKTSPQPPGTLFVGDSTYGRWARKRGVGRYWRFHKTFKYFYKDFGWGDFQYTLKSYKKAINAEEQGIPFFGPNDEFGPDTERTQKFTSKYKHKNAYQCTLKEHLKSLLSLNPHEHYKVPEA